MPPATAIWLSLMRICVVEPEPVIEAAAAADGVFLERAQPRRRLAGAAHPRIGAGDQAHEGRRRRGDAGEMAEKIERDALGAEHRAGVAGDGEEGRPGLDRVAVARLGGDGDARIEPAQRRFDKRQSADRPRPARRDDAAGPRAGRHRRNRGDVAGTAEVLFEGAVDRDRR